MQDALKTAGAIILQTFLSGMYISSYDFGFAKHSNLSPHLYCFMGSYMVTRGHERGHEKSKMRPFPVLQIQQLSKLVFEDHKNILCKLDQAHHSSCVFPFYSE